MDSASGGRLLGLTDGHEDLSGTFAASGLALAAKGADKAAELASRVADTAQHAAQTASAMASAAEAAAAQADAAFRQLASAYAAQVKAKLKALARAAARLLKKVAKAVAHIAVKVAKEAYKISGAADVVGCVTHPSLSGCAKAALTVALTVGTDGLGSIAAHAAEDTAEQALTHAAEDTAGAACGGMSFTAGTLVLLASGKTVPISHLKPGEMVLATNTKTGQTKAEPISVVMIHHDTNLYDLQIRSGHGATAVIDTTSNHPFWNATTSTWTSAGNLRAGDHLRTPAGSFATVARGWVPHDHAGWMWDLTIPGDHDFYISTSAAAALVHNCGLLGSIKRLVNVPKAWLDNRGLSKSLGGVSPEPNATVGDLRDFVPGNPQRAAKLAAGSARSDEDLLKSVFAPSDNQFIATNPSMPNTILQGNHRVYQLLQRAADPENQNITYDTPIFINFGDG